MDEARALPPSVVIATAMGVLLALATLVFLQPFLELLGARERELELAHGCLAIRLPSTILLGLKAISHTQLIRIN